MSNLKDLYNKFKSNKIDKPEYIKNMHGIHSTLFNYSEYIKATDIQKIEISDDNVVMTSRNAGIKIICNPNDYRIAPIEILNFQYYEKEDSAIIFKLCQTLHAKNPVIFDVGANIGWYTINLAKINSRSIVHAFEPVPATHDYLVANCMINGVSNVIRNKIGFSDKKDKMEMFYYAEGSVNASLKNVSERDDTEKHITDITTIDIYMDECDIDSLDFIKCDVEGAEFLVFKGGVKSIEKHKPIIFTEMLRKWSDKFNYHPNDIIQLLSGMGYQCYSTNGTKLVEFYSMDENTIETNFFFLHTVEHAKQVKVLT